MAKGKEEFQILAQPKASYRERYGCEEKKKNERKSKKKNRKKNERKSKEKNRKKNKENVVRRFVGAEVDSGHDYPTVKVKNQY